jgi:hypothetical protein
MACSCLGSSPPRGKRRRGRRDRETQNPCTLHAITSRVVDRVVRVPTQSTLDLEIGIEFFFDGVVTSRKARCERNRTVEVISDQRGSMGTTKTRDDGTWELHPKTDLAESEVFRALVERKKIKKKRKIIICKTGESPPVSLG